jgi:predicted enzyme related to lactoylglutathione lyase
MTIRRIVPNINSNKLAESKQFYVNYLGMTLAMDMEWVLTFASATNPTAQITIVKTDNLDDLQTNMSLSIEVDDVDSLFVKAKEMHYEITYEVKDEPWGVRRFWVKDPNAVTINVMMHLKG